MNTERTPEKKEVFSLISPDPEPCGIFTIFGIASSEDYILPLNSGQADVSRETSAY
jgi:hypothetical protein